MTDPEASGRESSRGARPFTVARMLKQVAVFAVVIWFLIAAGRALSDSARSEGRMTMGPHLFLYRHLQGLRTSPGRGEVDEIEDWHGRRDPYIVSGLVLLGVGFVGLKRAWHARKSGGARRILAITGLVLGVLLVPGAAWVVGANRAALRASVKHFRYLEQSELRSIAIESLVVLTPDYPQRRRYLQVLFERRRSYRLAYEARLAQPWYRHLVPLERPPLVRMQLMEKPPIPVPK